MEIDYTKSICPTCIHKKDIQGLGAKDLLGRSMPLVYTGSFCTRINSWIPEIKDGDGNIVSDVSECDGFKESKGDFVDKGNEQANNVKSFIEDLQKDSNLREIVSEWMKDKGLLNNDK